MGYRVTRHTGAQAFLLGWCRYTPNKYVPYSQTYIHLGFWLLEIRGREVDATNLQPRYS